MEIFGEIKAKTDHRSTSVTPGCSLSVLSALVSALSRHPSCRLQVQKDLQWEIARWLPLRSAE